MQDYLGQYRQKIFLEISNILEEHFQEHTSTILYQEELQKYLKKFILSGKCIRGLNVLAFSFDSEKIIDTNTIRVAAALEIFHSGLLIHDDIMDNDDVRRGLPSVHRFYQSLDENISDHDARALAICLGDVLYFLAYKVLGRVEGFGTQIIDLFSSEMIRVAYAQQGDVHFGGQVKVSEDAVIQMYKNKTAGYTFALPFLLGNILSQRGLDQNHLESLGQNLGIVFQIVDDSLEIFGSEEHIGKSVLSDLQNGKNTLYLTMLKHKLSTDDTVILAKIFEQKIGQGEFLQFKQLLEKYKIQSSIDEYISGYRSLVLADILELFEDHSILQQYMKFLVQYIIDREV